ncbi:hypothetical protein FQR65_LT17661 [Abscondita terminalis]|nr:hypothetical protein FQR65_LT17661 [Abscondita terminalis]
MATSLIKHKRITTTLAKAKALRTYVEPLITKSKDDTTHSRRTVFSYLKDKDAVTILFREISEKVANRPGGYTRIIKMENRLGDNAEMAFIELVDYNEVYGATAATEKKTTRRRGGLMRGPPKRSLRSCVGAGIDTLCELASTEVSQNRRITAEAGSNYNTAVPTTWPEQAQLAADGKFEELEKLKAN